MTLNKFQMSRLFFDLSAMVPHIGAPSTYLNIDTRPIELKFHMKTPNDRLAKFYTNCSGHMTKMVITSIYGRTL